MWSFFFRLIATFVLAGISAYLSYRKPEVPDPGTLDDLGNPRADEGTEITKIFGTVTLSDPQVVWFGDLRAEAIIEKGGRKYGIVGPKQKITIGYKYFLGVHFVLCLGPVDYIRRIRVDKRTAWDGLANSGQIVINKPTLFGSEKREGGISGTIDVLIGSDDQTANDYLAAKTSAPTPAYRGVTGLVLRQFYIGNSVSLRPFDMDIQRIFECDPEYEGGLQWYSGKAAILRNPAPAPVEIFPYGSTWEYVKVDFFGPGPDVPFDGDLEDPYSGFLPSPFYDDVSHDPLDPAHPTGTFIGNISTQGVWFRRSFTLSSSGVYRFAGAVENSIAVYLNGTKVFDPEPTNPFGASQDTFEILLGSGTYTIHCWVRDDFARNGYFDVKFEYLGPNVFDMNPVHILREVLISPDGGGTGNTIDAGTTWEAAADTIYNETFGISIAWRGGTDRVDFKREIERHIDARSFIDRRTGLWEIKLIRDDYDEGTLPVFDSSNVVAWNNVSFPQASTLLNQLVVVWNDPVKNEPTSLTISNPARIRMNNSQVFQEKVEYPGIQRADLGARVAMRDLSARTAALVTGEFIATVFPTDLNLGSVIKVNNPRIGLINKIVRVTEIEDGNIGDNSVRVKFIEDRFAIAEEAELDIEVPVVETNEPQAVDPRMVEEAPLVIIEDRIGTPNTTLVFTDDVDAGFLFVAGAQPTPSSYDAAIFRDLGSGYEELDAVAFVKGARTLGLMEQRADRTKVVVESTDDLTSVVVGSLAWINGEHVIVDLVEAGNTSTISDYWYTTEAVETGYTAFTLTVKRGALDTVPASHTLASPIVFYGEDGQFEDDIQTDGDVADVKLQTASAYGVLDFNLAPIDTVTFDSRANRPYAPGKFKLNDSYEQDSLVADYDFTWVHRDRLADSAVTPVSHDDAGVTSEASVTYRIRGDAYDAGGALISTFIDDNVGSLLTYSWDGITPTVPTDASTVVWRITSVRDTYESWQSPSIRTIVFRAPGDLAFEVI